MRRFLILFFAMALLVIGWAQFQGDGFAQTAQRKPARKVKVASTDRAQAAQRVDASIDFLRSSKVYDRAVSGLATAKDAKVAFQISLTPQTTGGESCVCVGGKGELNGKPVDWGCDCLPENCGTCNLR